MKTELKLKCCNCNTEYILSSEDFDKDVVKDPEIAEINRNVIKEYEERLKIFETAKKHLEDYYEKNLKNRTYRPIRTRRVRKLKNLYFERSEKYISEEGVQKFTLDSYGDSISIYDKCKERDIYSIPGGPSKPSIKDEYFVICLICEKRIKVEFPRKCSV